MKPGKPAMAGILLGLPETLDYVRMARVVLGIEAAVRSLAPARAKKSGPTP